MAGSSACSTFVPFSRPRLWISGEENVCVPLGRCGRCVFGGGEVLNLCLRVLQCQGEESWNLAPAEHPMEPCVN